MDTRYKLQLRDLNELGTSIALIELTPQQATLEEAFMEITREAVEFHGGTPPGAVDTPVTVGEGR